MKRVKLLFCGLAIFTVVGTALAFTKKTQTFCVRPPENTSNTCTVELINRQTVAAPLGTQYRGYVKGSNCNSPCTELIRLAIEQ